jgi:hypothetical protein
MSHERKGSGEMSGHISYLLRLWRERSSASIQWRASLQDPHSGERVGFAHLDGLIAFLRGQTGLAAAPEDSAKGGRIPKTGFPSDEGGSG